jgi:hypothetical protein
LRFLDFYYIFLHAPMIDSIFSLYISLDVELYVGLIFFFPRGIQHRTIYLVYLRSNITVTLVYTPTGFSVVSSIHAMASYKTKNFSFHFHFRGGRVFRCMECGFSVKQKSACFLFDIGDFFDYVSCDTHITLFFLI